MKSVLFVIPLLLLLSSTRAIQVNWQNYDGETFDNYIEEDSLDENLVGGSRSVPNLQMANDSAERVANGVFELYRLLSSDPTRLNQIVSNVKQVVGKDTYNVNHVFKHVKNGNYYLEVDTDKYNFAVNIVRLSPKEHSNHVHNTSVSPSKNTQNVEPGKQTARPETTTAPPKAEPGKQTARPETTTAPPKAEPGKQTARPETTTAPPKAEPGKQTARPETTAAPPKAEPGKQTAPGKQTPPAVKPLQPEDEYLRKLEDKRFRQILGQWYRVGVPSLSYGDVYRWRACEIITIYSHNKNYFYKEMNNIGNSTYEMKDTPMISVDKKNNLFKINNDVHAYKMVMLEGKNYKIKLFELTNISNQTEGVQFYAERLVDKPLLTNVFNEHYKNSNTVAIDQFCYSD